MKIKKEFINADNVEIINILFMIKIINYSVLMQKLQKFLIAMTMLKMQVTQIIHVILAKQILILY